MFSEPLMINAGPLFVRTGNEGDALNFLQYLQTLYAESAEYLPEKEIGFFALDAIRNRLKYPEPNKLQFLLFDHDAEGRVIGKIAFSSITRGSFLSCFLGYDMLKAYQNRGLMTKSLAHIIPKFFQATDLHRIQANVMPRNKASIRVLKKLGFEQEGYHVKYVKINGQWVDHLAFALLNEAEVT